MAWPGLRTPVDIRWNFIEKPPLPATSQLARRDLDVLGLDPQVALYEADRA
jgi:hypothetical protein